MSEVGDTLIEVLIAIVIIALTVTALLGGLVTAITSSTTQQSLATVDSVLNGFTQAARYEVEQLSSAPNWNCRTTPYRLIGTPSPISGPVGSSVTVFVTGFAPAHALSVSLGSTPATISSGSTTDSSGDAAVTFAVPAGVSGMQTVSVSDGTSTPSPTQFAVGGTVKGTAPVKYSVSVNNPIQQWDSQSSQWVATTSPSCPQSGAQLITVVANAPDGSAGSLNFVATGAANTTVLVSATSSSPSPILGDTLTFTAKVVPPNSTTAPPTGSIQWTFAQSPNSPTCANSTLSTVGGSNTAQATCTVSGAGVGLYTVTASYPASGTNGNYGAGSGTGTITVGKAASSATVTEVSAPTPAQPGSTLTFTATVGASPAVGGDPKPSGTVGWSITSPPDTAPTCANSQMPTGGTGTNTATCTVSNTLVGTYTVTATYGGDGNYTAAPAAQTTVSVTKATPTFSFTITPTNPQPGASFTVKATVNEPNGGPNPTGTLTWAITPPPPPSGPAPTCANSTLDNTGSGTCTVANAVKGTYTINVSYGGNGTYNPANVSTQVAVVLAPAGFDIQSVGNPADNKPDTGDQIVFTYNQAMSVDSIQHNWNGASETVTAEFTRQGSQSQLAILCTGRRCNTINIGTVALGDTGTHYVNGGFGGGTVDLNATMVASTNAAGQTVITVTLTPSSGSLSTVNTNTILTWTPSGSATSTTGVACATTAVNESGAPKKNF
jgi:type II secretory pathway pseudopilin PulG